VTEEKDTDEAVELMDEDRWFWFSLIRDDVDCRLARRAPPSCVGDPSGRLVSPHCVSYAEWRRRMVFLGCACDWECDDEETEWAIEWWREMGGDGEWTTGPLATEWAIE
jgi:hypothetical protein